MLEKMLRSHVTYVSHLAGIHLAAVFPSSTTAITSFSLHESHLMYI